MEKHEYDDHDCTPIVDSEFKCSDCDDVFDSNTSLNSHVKTQHSTSKISPPARRSSTSKDTAKKPTSENVSCNYCKATFRTSEQLMQHKRKEHSKVYPCTQCSMKFDQMSLLQRHIYRVHEKEKDAPKAATETESPSKRGRG